MTDQHTNFLYYRQYAMLKVYITDERTTMAVPKEDRFMAFVWPPEPLDKAVCAAAADSGFRVIYDLSQSQLESKIPELSKIKSIDSFIDIKISWTDLLTPNIGELIQGTGVSGLWVELHPQILTDDLTDYFNRLSLLQKSHNNLQCFPIVGDLETLNQLIENWPDLKALAIKGAEAAGFVGSESTLVLLDHLRSKLGDQFIKPSITIWGGIATPEAAAALLCVDATGIVCESVHWLTDLVRIDQEIKDKISKIKHDHTNLVGLNLNTPCRVFNKGNSKAIKELKEFSGALCGEEIRPEHSKFFASRILKEATPAYKANYGVDQIIPLGVEASFASSFVERYGESTADAISAFLDEIEEVCSSAIKLSRPLEDSPIPEEFGTKYPIIQGAMSWISDSPQFALTVAKAGGLPTLALGLMDETTLRNRLGNLNQVMGDYPYAVNVVALNENPYREAQFKWLAEIKPRFAVIAAGEPSHAKELSEAGIDSIYIAPNEDLLKMAFEAGVKYVICEGSEAGGHIGEHTTLTLSQMILDLKNREPDLFMGRRIILAGGIHDRTTAFIASALGADAVQMGTAYLATKEIVETNALTELYQELVLKSQPGGTIVTGEGVGLRVRSLKTPCMDAICSLERDFAAGSEDESQFRQKLEALSAGSLQVAARGCDKAGEKSLTKEECLDQGQFMGGACSGVLDKLITVGELHREVAEGELKDVTAAKVSIRPAPQDEAQEEHSRIAPSKGSGKGRSHKPHSTGKQERIAITGMSIVNSVGANPQEVWDASLDMKSGVIQVPPSKWNHDLYYDPKPRAAEKTYCKVAAFISLNLNRKDLGIPPQDFRTMAESTRISMWLAQQALAQSGLLESDINPQRVSVLISQNSGEAAGTLEDVIVRATSQNIVSSMGNVVNLTPELSGKLVDNVKQGRLAVDDTTLLGRLNCAAGGFICNRYGFQGPSFSVSAACATALVAMWSAVQMLRNGIIDAAIVGGAEEILTPLHFLEFSAIGALAGISGNNRPPHEASRPFDIHRDGMVLGEGGGMLVIERESVARKRGAIPLAYITSMGASNNHLGMVESSRVTQEIAIKSSFNDLPYGPDQVDMIECHATSTVQGDIEEIQALKNIFGPARETKLTSFKSQIGHTLGASGINSLIRGVMAMRSGTYAPTPNCDNPDPELNLEGSGLSISKTPSEWKRADGEPRRFQINAFGFGGSNYVAQVEEALDGHDTVLVRTPALNENKNLKDKTPISSPEGVFPFRTMIRAKPYRIGIVAQSEEEAINILQSVEPMSGDRQLGAKRLRALARSGIHIGPEDSYTAPLAFVFPGQGSHYAGMGKELYETFPIVRHWMDEAAKLANFDLLKLLFYDKEEDLQKTRWQQPALFTLEYAMVKLLISLGIEPAAMAGHSLGELTALCLAGVYSFEDGFRIVNKRAICMDKACEMNIDPGVMMAVDAPLDFLQDKIKDIPNVYITNINSPHQVVLGGAAETVEALGEELKSMGHRRTMLRVSMAFHSPIMECIHDELDEFIQGVEFHAPKIPVISNTTKLPFPDDPKEIKRIVMAHLESPVHWMQNVRTLWNVHGVRVFVEVGPRDILSNLIGDCLDDSEKIQTCLPSAESLVFRNAIAQLYAGGHWAPTNDIKHIDFPSVKENTLHPQVVKTDQAESEKITPKAPAPLGAAQATGLEHIIQRTINSFVMESFGRFIKPALLEAIKSEYDPYFTEEKLNDLLGSQYFSVAPQSHTPPPPLSQAHEPTLGPDPSQDQILTQEAAPSGGKKEEDLDFTEEVIGIIMEATGYDRDEIEPEMDLREDLSIRSSRLPVIMDAMEDRFKIKIDLEDFMDARTIQDIAERVSSLVGPTVSPADSSNQALSKDYPTQIDTDELDSAKVSLKRLVFVEKPIEATQPAPVELDSLESVAVLSATGGSGIRKELSSILRRDYGLTTDQRCFTGETSTSGDLFVDLLDKNCPSMIQEREEEIKSWSGLVLIIDGRLEDRLRGVEDVSQALSGFFFLLKTFMESKTKKFVMALRKGEPDNIHGRIMWQSITAMFLSAAQEYSSVQFRSVVMDDKTDMTSAMRSALDRNRPTIEHIWNHGFIYTRACLPQFAHYQEDSGIKLESNDVILATGGGYGVTSKLAEGLGELGCKLALIGRTVLDDQFDFETLLSGGALDREDLEAAVINQKPGLHDHALEKAVDGLSLQLEIAQTLKTLREKGVRADYFPCDVTDPIAVSRVVKEAEAKLGHITGIIHGAGALRDNYIRQMETHDFQMVVNVKLLGAWNLIDSIDPSKLKFFVCLSSAAAVQGNPGQINYAAGNRGMSELVMILKERYPDMVCKSMFLPPIEGLGMAEDPEVRAWMKRMNAAYVHVNELTQLFLREIFIGPTEDVWVMFLRSLPDLRTVHVDQSEPEIGPEQLMAETSSFSDPDFPMVDKVLEMDSSKGSLKATRAFSQEKDPWLLDHMPFKFLKHPPVSAIMALEYFMESCKILFPYLKVIGVKDATFLDITECPKGLERISEVSCHKLGSQDGKTMVKVALKTWDISPSGRVMDRKSTNYEAMVIMGPDFVPIESKTPGFPVSEKEFTLSSMNREEVQAWYDESTKMQGRYRIMDTVFGAGPGCVKGAFTYRMTDDFAEPLRSKYQYSPYLLEALMQLVNFYIIMENQNERRSMIPYRIGELILAKPRKNNERLTVEARLKKSDPEGIVWDARAIDSDSSVVMFAKDLHMKWFSA